MSVKMRQIVERRIASALIRPTKGTSITMWGIWDCDKSDWLREVDAMDGLKVDYAD